MGMTLDCLWRELTEVDVPEGKIQIWTIWAHRVFIHDIVREVTTLVFNGSRIDTVWGWDR